MNHNRFPTGATLSLERFAEHGGYGSHTVDGRGLAFCNRHDAEHSYNGLRLANALATRDPEAELTIFLTADAVTCAKRGQKTPEGYYSIERVLKRLTTAPHRVLLCGTCMDARGMNEAELVDGARRSSMDELAEPTMTADKVLTF